MINYFRKKRKTLSHNNRLFKYLRYAIGEIILVVIGILLALALNNWNNKRLKNIQGEALQVRLKTEIETNNQLLNEQIKRLKSLQEETQTLLTLFGDEYQVQSTKLIDSLLYGVISTPLYSSYTTTLDEALNTGQVSLIPSDKLRALLYDIPKKILTIHNYEEEITRDIEENLMPYLYQKISLRKMDEEFSTGFDVIGKSKLKHPDNRKILADLQFENMVDNKYFLLETLLMGYRDLQTVFNNTLKNFESTSRK